MLDLYPFDFLKQVREITELWIPEYNEERPHDSLVCVPPLTFKLRQSIEESTPAPCA